MKNRKFYDSPRLDIVLFDDEIVTGVSGDDEKPPEWDEESEDG